MQEKHICECCGSDNTEVRTSSRFFPIPFSDVLEYKNSVIHCNECNEDVEFEENQSVDSFLSVENPNYTAALRKSIDNMLSDLQKMDISQSHIERTFDIPARTLSKWRNDRNLPSAAAMSFLRIVRLFPWMLNVAEKNYDNEKSHHIALKNEVQYLFQKIEESGKTIDKFFSCDTNRVSCKIDVKMKENEKIDCDIMGYPPDSCQNEETFYSIKNNLVESL